jgi:hypothetical protein
LLSPRLVFCRLGDNHPREFARQFLRLVDEQRQALWTDMDRLATKLNHQQGDLFFGTVTIQANMHSSDTSIVNVLSKIFLGNRVMAQYNLLSYLR